MSSPRREAVFSVDFNASSHTVTTVLPPKSVQRSQRQSTNKEAARTEDSELVRGAHMFARYSS